jgi:hypothetical protein
MRAMKVPILVTILLACAIASPVGRADNMITTHYGDWVVSEGVTDPGGYRSVRIVGAICPGN